MLCIASVMTVLDAFSIFVGILASAAADSAVMQGLPHDSRGVPRGGCRCRCVCGCTCTCICICAVLHTFAWSIMIGLTIMFTALALGLFLLPHALTCWFAVLRSEPVLSAAGSICRGALQQALFKHNVADILWGLDVDFARYTAPDATQEILSFMGSGGGCCSGNRKVVQQSATRALIPLVHVYVPLSTQEHYHVKFVAVVSKMHVAHIGDAYAWVANGLESCRSGFKQPPPGGHLDTLII